MWVPYLGSLLLAVAALPGLVKAQPPNNGSVAFCVNQPPGFYCQPADALHVVQCPGGNLVACPPGRFCDPVGPVPPNFQCVAPFPIGFCGTLSQGSLCAPPGNGYPGYINCQDGKLTPCGMGMGCSQMNPSFAVCVPEPTTPITTTTSPTTPITVTQTISISQSVSVSVNSVVTVTSTPTLPTSLTVTPISFAFPGICATSTAFSGISSLSQCASFTDSVLVPTLTLSISSDCIRVGTQCFTLTSPSCIFNLGATCIPPPFTFGPSVSIITTTLSQVIGTVCDPITSPVTTCTPSPVTVVTTFTLGVSSSCYMLDPINNFCLTIPSNCVLDPTGDCYQVVP